MSLAPTNLNKLTSFNEYLRVGMSTLYSTLGTYLLLFLTLAQPTFQTHKHNSKHKHQHHEPPRPPASRGFNFIGEFDRPTLHGGAGSKQNGDVFVYVKLLSVPLFYWLLSCRPLNSELADKRFVFKLIYVFFYRPLH